MTGGGGAAPAPGKTVTLRWEPVSIERVTIRERNQELSPDHVAALKSSFALLGGQLQLQPIVLDRELVLIDGAHRLEAAKQSEWSHIAAMIVTAAVHIDRSLLEAEANRVRRNLSVLELEKVWRTHYEPGLRAAAKRRQLEGLRQGSRSVRALPPVQRSSKTLSSNSVRRSPHGQADELAESVIGISNNEDAGSVGPGESVGPAESLAHAAKRITGISLDTLNKVAQIRVLSTGKGVPAELQRAAESGLVRLTKPGASVESVHRALHNLQQRLQVGELGAETAQAMAKEAALERMLAETSLLTERLSSSLSAQVFDAARSSQANREMLRAARVALAQSLAITMSLECNLDTNPARALQRIGAEVTQLLLRTSQSRLDSFARSRRDATQGAQREDRIVKRVTEDLSDRAAA